MSFVQGQSPPWLQGTVTACTGPLSYKVCSTNGCVIHHHADHFRHAARQLPAVQTDPDGWTIFCSHFLTPFLMDGLIEQENHQRELPRCSQRTQPDNPWTDILHNYRGKCEEQSIIVLVVSKHSFIILGVLYQILHFLFVHLLVQENQLFIVVL